MASISELCWTSAEDLFRELDLDSLYARQVAVLGSFSSCNYPYVVLIHTGKITIGINLVNACESEDYSGRSGGIADRNINPGALFSRNRVEEHSE
jgi:hypothetical protein